MPGRRQRIQLLLAVDGLALFRSALIGDEASDEARVREMVELCQRYERRELAEGYEVEEASARDGYAVIARQYDVRANPLILAEEPVVQSLLAAMPPGRALDAACGTGRHAAFLLDRGHEVIGIDCSPQMLERAVVRAPGARFVLGEVGALPLGDGMVDLAVCALSLTHLPALVPPLSEIARVLRPWGRAVVSDVHPFAVLTGAHVVERSDAPRRVFVRNHVHLHSAYLSAFHATGLRVLRCLEPLVGERELEALAPPEGLGEAFRQALLGFPIAVVWELERAG